jgi:nicotinate-nucleotide adenylyltransferase
MRIAIFGGTFDPIHSAHLVVAEEAARQFQLDQILFIPNAVPPHKPGRTPYAQRLRMVQIAPAIGGSPFPTSSRPTRRATRFSRSNVCCPPAANGFF